jgi:hypothetical protein
MPRNRKANTVVCYFESRGDAQSPTTLCSMRGGEVARNGRVIIEPDDTDSETGSLAKIITQEDTILQNDNPESNTQTTVTNDTITRQHYKALQRSRRTYPLTPARNSHLK